MVFSTFAVYTCCELRYMYACSLGGTRPTCTWWAATAERIFKITSRAIGVALCPVRAKCSTVHCQADNQLPVSPEYSQFSRQVILQVFTEVCCTWKFNTPRCLIPSGVCVFRPPAKSTPKWKSCQWDWGQNHHWAASEVCSRLATGLLGSQTGSITDMSDESKQNPG